MRTTSLSGFGTRTISHCAKPLPLVPCVKDFPCIELLGSQQRGACASTLSIRNTRAVTWVFSFALPVYFGFVDMYCFMYCLHRILRKFVGRNCLPRLLLERLHGLHRHASLQLAPPAVVGLQRGSSTVVWLQNHPTSAPKNGLGKGSSASNLATNLPQPAHLPSPPHLNYRWRSP